MRNKIMTDRKIYKGSHSISRDAFIKRVNKLFIGSWVFIAILVFLLVFQPMKSELEKTLLDNFAQVAHTNYHSFLTVLQRAVEGQKSLSSRTMIKNAILDYRSGKMSLEELTAYTQEKYVDGARVLNELIYAERIVDGTVIARYANAELIPEDRIQLEEIEKTPEKESSVRMILLEDEIHGIVTSPILYEGEVLGFDILLYDFSNQIHLLCSEQIDVQIVNTETYNQLQEGASVVEYIGDQTRIEKSSLIYIISPLDEGRYFVSMQEREIVFSSIRELGLRVLFGGSLSFAVYALLTYVYIIRHTKGMLLDLEFSRNEFKEIAYRDQLTGLFNRHFLDVWNRSIRSDDRSYAIVMADIDRFKYINDNYGHLAGDWTLQRVGGTILKTIRHSDYAIRYGGDEFVLILADVSEKEACALMERIHRNLEMSVLDSMVIRLSYGLCVMSKSDDLESLLQEADHRMYENKQKKSSTKQG